MEVILNEFSIDCQFKTMEDVADMLVENTLPALKAAGNDLIILKTEAIYLKEIFPDTSLGKLLGDHHSYTHPALSKFKSTLVQLTDDPYITEWKTDRQTEYQFDGLSGENLPDLKIVPNVLTEAVTRNIPLLSFPHKLFGMPEISAKIGNKAVVCANWVKASDVNFYLFQNNSCTFGAYLACQKYALMTKLAKKPNGSYYIDDGFLDGRLSVSDGIQLCEELKHFILALKTGTINKKQSDHVRHGTDCYFEFRFSLSNDRIFRIYYTRKENKIICMNSHLKKTQAIPSSVMEDSIRILKKL